MSWKSFVSAGLLCVLASPAMADPTLSVNLAGLNSAGNWIWHVAVTPTDADPGTGGHQIIAGGTPLAAELGFRESGNRELLSATYQAAGTFTGAFDTENPGTDIFGADTDGDWETHIDVDPGAGVNMKPTGLQVNTPTDEVFAALGSPNFTTNGAHSFVRIEVQRPTSSSAATLETTLEWLGAYGGNGRIAEWNGTTTVNFDTYAGSASKGVRAGNANLSSMVDVGDLAILASNYNEFGGKRWQDADFTGDGNVDVGDLAVLASNYNQADANWTTQGLIETSPGAGSGSAAGVPEPTSLVMLLVGSLVAFIGRRNRR